MKFRWYRFSAYLVSGLMVFGIWTWYNYTTYVEADRVAQTKIAKNIQIIEETQEEIVVEQNTLENIQRVLAPPAPPAGMAMGDEPSNDDPIVNELQERIDKLEAEKAELEAEKHFIKKAIEDSVSVFKGVKVDNPLVNAIIIPIFLYFMKKLIDLLFIRLEDRHERRHAV